MAGPLGSSLFAHLPDPSIFQEMLAKTQTPRPQPRTFRPRRSRLWPGHQLPALPRDSEAQPGQELWPPKLPRGGALITARLTGATHPNAWIPGPGMKSSSHGRGFNLKGDLQPTHPHHETLRRAESVLCKKGTNAARLLFGAKLNIQTTFTRIFLLE